MLPLSIFAFNSHIMGFKGHKVGWLVGCMVDSYLEYDTMYDYIYEYECIMYGRCLDAHPYMHLYV